MDTKQFHRRVWAIVVLLAIVLTSLGSTLYDLQINNGEEYYKQSKYKIAETETVEAGRGQILDRNGRVLVSDRAVYQVKLNTSLMGSTQERNATILSLIQAAHEAGVEWSDSLPISAQAPFFFTTDQPYYTVTQKDDGTQVRSLTRLGKLAVAMKWIQDPTKDPEPAGESSTPAKKPGLLDRIKSFFTGETGDASSPSTKEETPYTLPTATELLGLMCRSFELKGEGAVDEKTARESGTQVPALNIGDLDSADARAAAGVLYELSLYSKGVNWNPYIFAEDVDIDFISRVKELSLNGVVIEATTVRQYHTAYAAHLLGRVAAMSPEEWSYYKTVDEDGDGTADYQMDDTVGKEGVEKAFESYLRGTPGVRALERNTNGKIVSQTWLTEPEPGDNVVLTIDIDLQKKVEDTLAESLPNLVSKEVEGAACVVLDVKNSDVLACGSYPTFDLASYGADYNKHLENPLKPLFNRALQGTYAPGSTFKMVTAVAGLEEGIVTPTTQIRDEGQYTYYGTPPYPKCWIYRQKGGTHGLQNVSQAIENSCNYYFFEVGRQLGIERITDYAGRFGLGQKTGIELDEKAGIMAGPAYTESLGGTWYEGSTLSVAIGQESSQFTPIQLANYIATLVNGGTRNATHLLKEVKSSDFSQILYTYEPQVLSTIDIQSKNLEAVKKGMLALTTEGSVRRYFQDLPFRVGAKTGSAQISTQTESNAVFVCFAPYDDPEIAVAMVVEHGGSGSELGAMAADILDYYFSAQETRDEPLTENTLVR
ncbi:penicillin-binding transpeptidase domain-containing protein [Pseudoflavonifractor phocaeensis]|uniref:penicillin-binding transpeptidase domain-containing protein n=1 Tax=Pseudoflavonifractor phocaeensis TaxID=1870988 RepID=UPI001F1E22C9|nr:penicillin-binding transpeptidase domain-containing protein [Pseudoflavonifractor phocaeensis]MCF2662100.1 penicillin-binding protein [Pseudoflavonifractor phocaeensis]